MLQATLATTQDAYVALSFGVHVDQICCYCCHMTTSCSPYVALNVAFPALLAVSSSIAAGCCDVAASSTVLHFVARLASPACTQHLAAACQSFRV